MPSKLYAMRGGSVCPACRCEDVNADGQVQMDGQTGTQEISCNKCSARWEDVVQLTGYVNLRT